MKRLPIAKHEVYIQVVKFVFLKEWCRKLYTLDVVKKLFLATNFFAFDELASAATEDVKSTCDVVSCEMTIVEGPRR